MKEESTPKDPSKDEVEEKKVTFEELGFNYDLLDGLDSMGFIYATPVQALAVPHILNGKDVMAIAQTGTGKTAAFLLPVIDLIMSEKYNGKTSCLIVSPTRELAKQIDLQAEALGYFTGVSSVAVYGGGEGNNWDVQKKALTSGADIIAATPGRLLSHMNMGYVDFSHIKYFILDEADRMLDMGFSHDIVKIGESMPDKKQTLMFSATMPNNIRKLSKALLNEPEQINIAISKPADNVLQVAYNLYDNQKVALITELLKGKSAYKKTIIFSSSKKAVSVISRALNRAGLKSQGVSSDLDQKAREQALKDFSSGNIPIIVATDVLSRGIDIKDINLVINYDVPPDPEDYIHRIGRTARANTTGVGITFITEKDQVRFSKIEELLGEAIRKTPLPEGLGRSPKYDPAAQKRRFSSSGYKGKGGSKGGGKKNYNRGPRK
jgi:ATP-dependent RNA helicase RhlE